MLSAIDNLYQNHLYDMDDLRQSVYLRSYGQRDPLVEYKQEAFHLYETLMGGIKDSVCTSIFRYQLIYSEDRQPITTEMLEENGDQPEFSAAKAAMAKRIQTMHQQYGQFDTGESPAQPAQPVTIRREMPKVGRNDPCPCGSGKKYKNCHGK